VWNERDITIINIKSSSTADEGRSAGWKLGYLFIFLLYLESPAMSTGSSQVGAALSPSF